MDVRDFGSEPDERSVDAQAGEVDGDETRVLAGLVGPLALEGEFLMYVERRGGYHYEPDDDGFEIVEMGEFGERVEDGEVGDGRGTSDQEELEELREARKKGVKSFDVGHGRISLFEEFVPDHLEGDIERIRRFLPLSEGIFVVEDVNGNFLEFQAEGTHLVDEFARVFHAVHGEAGAFNGSDSDHAVAVMRIRKADAGNEAGEYAASHEDDLSKERDVGIGFHYEARTEDDVEGGIVGKRLHEIGHVRRVVLAVGVEGDDERDAEPTGETAEEFETGFERGSPAPILRVADGHDVFAAGEDGGGSVAGTVVDYEDFRESRGEETVYYAFETGRFVIRTDEESDVVLRGCRAVVGYRGAFGGESERSAFRSAHMERHFSDEARSVFAVLFRLIEKEEREIRKEYDASVYENVGASRDAEDAADEVERLRNVREKQESAADSEEHQEMEGVEFLPFGDVERDDEYHHAGNREEKLEEVHYSALECVRLPEIYAGSEDSQKINGGYLRRTISIWLYPSCPQYVRTELVIYPKPIVWLAERSITKSVFQSFHQPAGL